MRQSHPYSTAVQNPRQHTSERGSRPPDRPREADPRVLGVIRRAVIEADERSETRDEHRSARAQSEVPQSRYVAHLMDVNAEYEAHPELPAVQRPIQTHGREHRQQRVQLEEAVKEKLELSEERNDDSEGP